MNKHLLGKRPGGGKDWNWAEFWRTFLILIFAAASLGNAVWTIGFQPSRRELRDFEARVRAYVNERAYVVPRPVSLPATPDGSWF